MLAILNLLCYTVSTEFCSTLNKVQYMNGRLFLEVQYVYRNK